VGSARKLGEDGGMMKQLPRKSSTVRRKRYSAPVHKKRKFITAPLSPNLRAEHGTRSMTLIVDDTVSITRGDRRFAEGKILRVDNKSCRVYIEGVTRSRLDGSTVQIPIRPENLMITRLNMDDPWRRSILERKSFSTEEE
jgi:large subunit ribosomal protein L24